MATAAAATIFVPEITALEEFDESINVLWYGDHGAGKTVLGATLNERAVIFATEAGAISARRAGSTSRVVRITGWKHLDQMFKWLKAQLVAAGAYEKDGVMGFEWNGQLVTWIIIDTATEMQELGLRHILDTQHKANPGKRDIDIPAIQDHQKWQNSFKRFVKAFNDLPINVLWLAAEMSETDDEERTNYRPAFQGRNGIGDPTAMSRWVTGTVHAYGRLVVRRTAEGEEYRRLIMRPPVGKDRYNITEGLGYIDRPDMIDIENRITTPPAPAKRRARATTESE